ncbi:MAG: DUF3105 domain-containing protein, partial [Actinobacteria bacterium]|nr:DUF3105 domain-containing protein [Actinomycetota bacterium]
AMVARLSGEPSHEAVRRAVVALANLEHRGAAGADPNTGDGAGILMQLPDELLRGVLEADLPPPGAYGVGVCFLPRDRARREAFERLLTETVEAEGAGQHTTDPDEQIEYDSEPPAIGRHYQEWPEDDIYEEAPRTSHVVHTLEHGRIIFQYKPGTDADVVRQLTDLYNEDVAGSGGAYHSVLMQNNSGMEPQVAAVAWRQYMTCDELTPQAVDALREFREARVDKAPEVVP